MFLFVVLFLLLPFIVFPYSVVLFKKAVHCVFDAYSLTQSVAIVV